MKKVEDSNDPASFYVDDGAREDFEPFASTTPLQHQRPRPPPSPSSSPTIPQQLPPPFRFTSQSSGPRPGNQDPFGFGAYQQNQNPSSTTSSASSGQPPNPMHMDGYRNILEELLGGIGYPPATANGSTHIPNHDYPPFPGPSPQQPSSWGGPLVPQPIFQGPGHFLARTQGQSTPTTSGGQSQQSRPIRRFHYSVTTYGPDGRVHHISNHPRSDTPLPEGRQVPVPTLEDFLGLHGMPPYGGGPTTQGGGPNYGEDPFSPGSLGTILRQLMESVAPMHGDPGDYLRHVCSLYLCLGFLLKVGRA